MFCSDVFRFMQFCWVIELPGLLLLILVYNIKCNYLLKFSWRTFLFRSDVFQIYAVLQSHWIARLLLLILVYNIKCNHFLKVLSENFFILFFLFWFVLILCFIASYSLSERLFGISWTNIILLLKILLKINPHASDGIIISIEISPDCENLP